MSKTSLPAAVFAAGNSIPATLAQRFGEAHNAWQKNFLFSYGGQPGNG